KHLGGTAMFAARFRENAARALLLPKRRPQGRTPLWLQRRKAADLLAVASRYPSFPILLETYRECLRDVFDLPGLVSLLKDVERRKVRVTPVETQTPSPFAAALLFDFTGNFLYENDAPLAERRAAALVLDHAQLQELLGAADLRELLDADAIEEVALERARLVRPLLRDADDAHDLLLSHGPLTRDEVAARRDTDRAEPADIDRWIEMLLADRRAIDVRIAGEPRLAAAEDAARLRDALGVAPPPGLPAAFLEMVADPLGDLVARFGRTRGPFTAAQCAERLGLGEAPVLAVLQPLVDAGRVVAGDFTPGGRGREFCDAGVLREIKRRSLAKLRKQVEAAPPESLARFLPEWHGVTRPRRGLDGLLDVVEQLQGAPIVASALETEVLPARLTDYQPNDLDELFHAGEVVWRGVEGLGSNDGRIALYLADHADLLAPLPTAGDANADDGPPDPTEVQLRELLTESGALRFDEIKKLTGAFPNDLLDALWRLVWSGEATNDTLAPVRSLLRQSSKPTGATGRPGSGRRGGGRRRQAYRSRRRDRMPGSEGRWSLVTPSAATPTERQAAIATQLVERHGVLTRPAVGREQTAGGFSAIYPVLKAMEESGRVRRGYFVEGLGGAQFAAAGADDLLRAKPDDTDEPQAVILAATDPANAYGAALPWPEASGDKDKDTAGRPQRAAGALVVLLEGRLTAYVGRTGRRLTTFLADDEPQRS
ncbi:MAG: DEAD/DEAH box helicase, partial [Planctomycetota bacterium]